MTASFGRLSKEWTPTLCDVIVVTMATIPTQICERWMQHIQIDALIWQETLELIEIKLQ